MAGKLCEEIFWAKELTDRCNETKEVYPGAIAYSNSRRQLSTKPLLTQRFEQDQGDAIGQVQ